MIERKMGWDRHRQKLMDLETDYRKKRFDSDKEKLRRILSTREDITGSTKFKTLAQALSSDSTYRSTLEENREVICNEYVAELRVREKVCLPSIISFNHNNYLL